MEFQCFCHLYQLYRRKLNLKPKKDEYRVSYLDVIFVFIHKSIYY